MLNYSLATSTKELGARFWRRRKEGIVLRCEDETGDESRYTLLFFVSASFCFSVLLSWFALLTWRCLDLRPVTYESLTYLPLSNFDKRNEGKEDAAPQCLRRKIPQVFRIHAKSSDFPFAPFPFFRATMTLRTHGHVSLFISNDSIRLGIHQRGRLNVWEKYSKNSHSVPFPPRTLEKLFYRPTCSLIHRNDPIIITS